MPIPDADHDAHVERAIELAREAGERGDGPYGSLLVHEGEVVMEETNREETDEDLALHPELTLARRADRELTADERGATVLYTSTEPCPMCAAGIAYAGLGGVVYSVSGQATAETFDGPPGIPCEEVFERLDVEIPVEGGVLEADGLAIHERYR